jgi:2'-5' RNA ligase
MSKQQSQLERLPIKLVEPANSHIALKFLDKLNDEQIELIDDIIDKSLEGFSSFSVKVDGLLFFPNLIRPRVIALKVISQPLEKLADKLISRLEKLPFVIKEERRYTPHITLARVKADLAKSEKEKLNNLKFSQEMLIEKLQLFESRLTSTGPIYTILKEYSL